MENEQIELAWRLVENTGSNVFITGKAGTGKTTFLRRLKEESSKTIVVLAPTGIAALNAGGMTIHSFFQLSFSPYIPGIGQASSKSRFDRYSKNKRKLIRSIDTIVIDEISMVRADILDAIDSKLRKYRNPALPLGGVQLVMIGDLQQLPPVVVEDEWNLLKQHYRSPFFFDSQLLRTTPFETIELKKVYRQKDSHFLSILNAIRENKADSKILSQLNSRHIPNFNPPDEEGYIRLMTHNYQANRLNEEKMKDLPSAAHVFKARIEGEFPEMMYPVEKDLILKKGAQVMFIKNDSSGSHRYYNGLIGRISGITGEKVFITTKEHDSPIEVSEEMWENTSYTIDSKENVMKERVDGRFYQIPLRPAWAITIHKSQGLTFDKAIINASSAFAHGQTYVALSRCRTLEGMVLDSPLPSHSIISDNLVTDFITDCTANQADNSRVDNLQSDFQLRLILELIDFTPLRDALDVLHRAMQNSHSASYPNTTAELGKLKDTTFKNLRDVSIRFQGQIRNMELAGSSDDKIHERIKAGCNYFLKELNPIFSFIENIPADIDNKEAEKKYLDALEKMEYEARLKTALMSAALRKKLSANDFLKIKREISTSDGNWIKKSVKTRNVSDDMLNPGLYEKLSQWRLKKAKDAGTAAYNILGNRSLIAISNDIPEDETDLLAIPGIGRKKLSEYGEEILEIINAYKDQK
ncbi:MAG: AAA family ATPase [Muribaculaceae bacterium]|nr:AAA family ATPase [Muribaculaceae bacterium]